MSNVNVKTLTVHPSIPQKKLGRYRAIKGAFLIRQDDVVVYIGASTNICKTAMRLFQKDGVLSHLDRDRVQFEIVFTTLRSPSVETVLKRHFKPKYNKRIRKLEKPTEYEKRQCKRILKEYLEQSSFEAQGEHKSDLNNA